MSTFDSDGPFDFLNTDKGGGCVVVIAIFIIGGILIYLI